MSIQRTLVRAAPAVAASLAFALVACTSDAPTALDSAAPGTDLVAVGADFAAGGVTHVVTGKGTLWVPDPQNEYINIAFDARVMPDGSARGHWHHQFRSRTPAGRIFVEVTCLTVVGNQAWMAGYAIQAGAESNLGRPFGLRVVDNGEGNGAVDQMTRTIWPGGVGGEPSDYCTNMPTDHPLWPLAGGNVQVR